MLYQILYPLIETARVFNIFKYLTFRSICAVITALLVSFVVGPWIISKLEQQQIHQIIRTDGPESHLMKKNTPTMGGLIILTAITITTILWADLTNPYIWLALFITISFGIIGFADDYLKVSKKNSKGLSATKKLFWQSTCALAVALFLYLKPGFNTALYFPFFKNIHPDLGLIFIPFAVLVIVGASNAVNLTDGLDGLAIGPVTINAATYTIFTYLAGHSVLAAYLQIPAVTNAGELSVFCAAVTGAGLGFLWYNSNPAEVFMGDTGSLALGGALGTVAVLCKQEILLVVVGALFVVEALSVILQVGSYKYSGKRIFLMAPIHHHFERKGVSEQKITVRCWIITILMALIALSTLKMR